MPNATYQISKTSIDSFCDKKVLKRFHIYGRGGQLDHVTLSVLISFRSHDPISFRMKSNFKSPNNFREK